MMESIYFAKEGEKGITCSAASNYIARAKDLVSNIESANEHLRFYQESAGLLNSNQTRTTKKSSGDISKIKDNAKFLGRIYGFIAFYMEAIKEHEKQLKAIKDYSFESWLKDNDLEYPSEPARPFCKVAKEAPKNVEEQRKLLSLNALASVYGKLVHEDGYFRNARKEAYRYSKEPVLLKGQGQDAIVYTYDLAYPLEVIDAEYEEIQKSLNEVTSELNRLKNTIKDRANAENAEYKKVYDLAYADYKSELNKVANERQKLISDYNFWVANQTAKAAKVKLVIPVKYEEFINSFKQG